MINGNKGHRILVTVPFQPTARKCWTAKHVYDTYFMPFSILMRNEAEFFPSQYESMNLQRTHCPLCEQIFVKHYSAILKPFFGLNRCHPTSGIGSFNLNLWYNHCVKFYSDHNFQIKGSSSPLEYVCRALRATPTGGSILPELLYVGPSASLWLLECRDL